MAVVVAAVVVGFSVAEDGESREELFGDFVCRFLVLLWDREVEVVLQVFVVVGEVVGGGVEGGEDLYFFFIVVVVVVVFIVVGVVFLPVEVPPGEREGRLVRGSCHDRLHFGEK